MFEDFLTDLANGTEDLVIEDGDFKSGDSNIQEQQHIIKAVPGHFYQSPTIGAAITEEQNSSITPQDLEQRIRLALEADNMRVDEVKVSKDFKVEVEAIRQV